MTEPTAEDYQANLAAAVAMFKALGPFLVRLEVSPRQAENLRRRVTPERRPDLAARLAAVDLVVVHDLPHGAVRLHYSDGRVVTRWRVVMHPKVLQVTLQETPYGKSHGLRLMLNRHGYGWTPDWRDDAGRVIEHVWKGQRVSPYIPGLTALAQVAGLELTAWQRDYVARAVRHPGPITLQVPRRLW